MALLVIQLLLGVIMFSAAAVLIWGPKRLVTGSIVGRREVDAGEVRRLLRQKAKLYFDRRNPPPNKGKLGLRLALLPIAVWGILFLSGQRTVIPAVWAALMFILPSMYYASPKQVRASVRAQVPILLVNLRAILADEDINRENALLAACEGQRGILFERLRYAMEQVRSGVLLAKALRDVTKEFPDPELDGLLYALVNHPGTNAVLDPLFASMETRIFADAEIAIEELISKRQVWVLVIGVVGALPALGVVLFLPPLAGFLGWN